MQALGALLIAHATYTEIFLASAAASLAIAAGLARFSARGGTRSRRAPESRR